MSLARRPRPGDVGEDAEVRLGRRLREKRLSKDLRQGELGARVGLAPEEIEAFETGRVPLPASVLWDLAVALNCPIDHFMADD